MTSDEMMSLVTIEKDLEQMQNRVKNLVFKSGGKKVQSKAPKTS